MSDFVTTHMVLMIGGVIAFVMGSVAYLILAERKIAARIQDRYGPNRVGPYGLLQPLADGGKMFLKEDVIPAHVDRVFFLLAPIAAFSTALLAIALVPVGATTTPPAPQPTVTAYEEARSNYEQAFQFVVAPGLDIGILYVFAIGSLAVYGVILAGWSANNKYSLIGALRSSAQIISYEIPLGMSVLGVVLVAGSLNIETIVAAQASSGWNVLFQPFAFLIFMTSVFAECNRLPFDLPEAEQELVGGYHTEYSNSMKLGLMLLGEYAHMITTSFLMVLLFWGGWSFFGLERITSNFTISAFLKTLILGVKTSGFVFFYLVVRWTIPRFRFDQLMDLAWKTMMPAALAHVVLVLLVKRYQIPTVMLPVGSIGLLVLAGVIGLKLSRGHAPHSALAPA